MCEQMGTDPIPEEIPIEYTDLDFNGQLALKIFNMLPDNIEGMSGSWLGKDFSGLGVLLDVYEVVERQKVLDLMMILISETDAHYKRQQQAKAQKSKRR